VTILEKIAQQVDIIAPVNFQKQIEHAALIWHSIAWFHKYLHIVFPELVTWTATDIHALYALNRVGETPVKSGIFAQDCKTIKFWDSFPALQETEPDARYMCGRHLSPRQHFAVNLSNDHDSLEEVLDRGVLAFGPEIPILFCTHYHPHLLGSIPVH
ncbi:MAG: hypothetical protein P8O70_18330, partial [SAR324 cluster bacterium]|nr:hypothetical protein [SAR324 cluster bacterium]